MDREMRLSESAQVDREKETIERADSECNLVHNRDTEQANNKDLQPLSLGPVLSFLTSGGD